MLTKLSKPAEIMGTGPYERQ